MGFINLDQSREEWRADLKTVMKIRVDKVRDISSELKKN